jgi:HEPN domain-containing protein
MDEGARQLILDTLEGCPERAVLQGFLRDAYPDLEDYVKALREVWGEDAAEEVGYAVTVRLNEQSTIPSFGDAYRGEENVANAALLHVPEPDFRLAVHKAVQEQTLAINPLERINAICGRRGIPWEFTAADGFTWIGDAEVEELAMRPALSAVQDPRLTGAKDHFSSARSELAEGTPKALRQSVHESACAVESAMKAVLTQRGVEYDERDTAFKLFGHLVAAGIVPQFMEYAVLSVASPRNKVAGHGGEEPHDVSEELAETVMASAATAIAYLQKLLP